MKSVIFTCFCLIVTLLVYSQEKDTLLHSFLRNAQYQKALDYMDELEASKGVLTQKAFCYKSLRNYSKAIEILQPLSEEYPDDFTVKMDLALCYESSLQYPKSIACYDDLIRMDSANIYFKLQKADLLYLSEKYSLALEQYQKVLDLYDSNYLARRRAMCFEKMNQQDSAQYYFKHALEMDSTDSYSAVSLVKMHVRKEDFFNALEDSQKFINRDSTNVQMNALNAFSYYSLDRYEEAARRFERCRVQGDSSLIVNRGLGISYFFLENDSCAQPFLNQAFLQDTTNNVVLYALASVDYNVGKYAEAIECYGMLLRRISTSRPTFFRYYNELAKSYEGSKQFGPAVDNYVTAQAYAPNDQKYSLLFKIAWLLEYELKDYYLAYQYYEMYRGGLSNYHLDLEAREIADSTEVKSVQAKIVELGEHLEYLKGLYSKKAD